MKNSGPLCRNEVARIAKLLSHNPHDQEIQRIKRISESFEHYITLRWEILRLYKTEGGYLGSGEKSIRQGDQVWMIYGSRVLHILRRTSAEGEFTLVGEAFVHGFMHGEIFETEAKDRIIQIALV